MKKFDEAGWARTKSLLREHLTAPELEHPDFVNHRVLEGNRAPEGASASGDLSAAVARLVRSRSDPFCGGLDDGFSATGSWQAERFRVYFASRLCANRDAAAFGF